MAESKAGPFPVCTLFKVVCVCPTTKLVDLGLNYNNIVMLSVTRKTMLDISQLAYG